MDINGGSLSFKSIMDNDQMNGAIEETLRRIQGLTDATVKGGELMDGAFGKTAAQIRSALSQIGEVCSTHETKISELQSKYQELGVAASEALKNGRDDELRAIQEQMNAIKGEIKVREQLLDEARVLSDQLEKEASAMEANANAANDNAQKQTSMRTRLRELREELVRMEMAGLRGTDAYRALQEEAGRLTDAWSDATAQANIMAHDQRGFQGVISGLSGVSGAFSAAQGAVSLFAGENENLQKIMLKVQSLMAITVGLQQLEQTLNKDSAFQLVTMNGVREWWNKLLVESGIKTQTETAATIANTAAKKAGTIASGEQAAAEAIATGAVAAETTAATAGTAANLTLAGAFRAVGAAIKSIPVFGWIAAGIGAIIAVVSKMVSKTKEAKKAVEEFGKSIAENAYKPIGSIELLAAKWDELGDDLEAKNQFILDNAKAFDELGVSIKGVTDAENLLNSQKDAFIDAQIQKAKAMAYIKQAEDDIKKLMELENEYNAMPDTKTVYYANGQFGGSSSYETHNTAKDAKKAEIDELQKAIETGYSNAAEAEKTGLNKLKEAGIVATQDYTAGSLGAIEQAIALKQAALKHLTSNTEYAKVMAEIADLQKQAKAITGESGSGGSSDDPFLKKLSQYKTEYARFQKWMNSGDKIIQESAAKEFSGLLAEGATYLDYLRNQRDAILSINPEERTKSQNKQLRQLNDTIAEETKRTVLESFNNELSSALNNAQTAIEMLKVIEQKRKELANDGTDLDNDKKAVLDEAEEQAQFKAKSDLENLMNEFASFADKKKAMEAALAYDIQLLEEQRAKATADEEIAQIDRVIEARKAKFADDTKTDDDREYDRMLATYRTYEEQKNDIQQDFEKQRAIAKERNDKQLLAKLDKAEADSINKLAMETFTNSDIWNAVFDAYGNASLAEIDKLIDQINNKTLEITSDMSERDLQMLIKELKELRKEVTDKNPFQQLGNAVKEFRAESSEANMDRVIEAGGNLADSFRTITDSMRQIADLTGNATLAKAADLADDIVGNLQAAEKGAEAWGGWWGAIIGGVLDLIPKIIKWAQGANEVNKEMETHERALSRIKTMYEKLSWEVGKALGGDVYKKQNEVIKNMQQQIAELTRLRMLENSKKNADVDVLADYQSQIDELRRNIDDLYDDISNDILQTSGQDFANELGNALVSAFEKGENAASAFEATVNDVLKNAIVNQLKKNFLEKQLQGTLDDLQKSMGTFDNAGNFVFNGLTDDEIASFKQRVQGIADTYNQALNVYADLFKDLNNDSDKSLTGAVKGVTEETASIVAGQMNAIRINQMESTQILRNQLLVLNQIATNTAYCQYLAKIDRIISLIEAGDGNSLRSQGLS